MTDTQALTLRLDRDLYERLRQAAFDQRRPISELIREAVEAHLSGSLTELRVEVERLSQYAPDPRVEDLLSRSSLGTPEAQALIDSVPREVGRLVVRLSHLIGERDAALEKVADAWDEGYDAGDPYQRRGDPEEAKKANPYRHS